MVSTRPPTSKSSSPFSNPLVTVTNAPITIGIIVTCMFHSFISSLSSPEAMGWEFGDFEKELVEIRLWAGPGRASPAGG